MLGVMTIRKDELKFREFDRYRGFYCGLCHAIGKRCGGFKIFNVDNAQRTSRFDTRVRSLENLLRHSTIPARLGPYSARNLFWPLSFIVSVSGSMNSLTC